MILILGNVFLHIVSVLINFVLNEEGIKVKGSRKDYMKNVKKLKLKYIFCVNAKSMKHIGK